MAWLMNRGLGAMQYSTSGDVPLSPSLENPRSTAVEVPCGMTQVLRKFGVMGGVRPVHYGRLVTAEAAGRVRTRAVVFLPQVRLTRINWVTDAEHRYMTVLAADNPL